MITESKMIIAYSYLFPLLFSLEFAILFAHIKIMIMKNNPRNPISSYSKLILQKINMKCYLEIKEIFVSDLSKFKINIFMSTNYQHKMKCSHSCEFYE